MLTALVIEAQSNKPAADVALELMLLALWPGLDAARGRLLRHYRGREEDLVSDVSARITVAIRTLDLSRVNRIAATLLRNLERDLRRDLKSSWKAARLMDRLDLHAERIADPTGMQRDPAWCLRSLSAGDSLLVLAVAVGGFTQKEAGQRLGIGHDAARKRFQRALKKLAAAGADQ